MNRQNIANTINLFPKYKIQEKKILVELINILQNTVIYPVSQC